MRRGGMVMIYSVVAMTVLMAIGSLAIDYGRVQLVKTEMLCAVDAAARSASTYLPSDTAGARAAAISMAASHTVDGRPLILQTGDIEFGKWNSTTNTLDTNSTSPDAVRISAYRTTSRGNAVKLTMGELVGYPTQNVLVRQTTQYSSGTNGIIGLNGVTTDNDLFVASYNSGVTTTPSTSSYRTNGILGSNGYLYCDWGSDLYGTALLGPAAWTYRISVNGSTQTLSSNIPTPTTAPWSPGTNPGGVAQSYSVTNNTTLAGGTYWFTSLSISSNRQLSFSGPATIYINGNVTFGSSSSLIAYNSIPSNLKIYVIGTRTFGNSGADWARVTADIEGPGMTFRFDDDFTFMGRLTASYIIVDHRASFFYDEAFGGVNTAGTVTNVR